MEYKCSRTGNQRYRVDSCKLCLAHLHLVRIFHFYICYCSNPCFYCKGYSTGSNCRNNWSGHQECPLCTNANYWCNRSSTCRDTNRDYLGTRKIYFKIFEISWKIKNTQNTIRLKATVRGTAPDFLLTTF